VINASILWKLQKEESAQLLIVIAWKMIDVFPAKLDMLLPMINLARDKIQNVLYMIEMDVKNVLKVIELIILEFANMLMNIVGISVRKVAAQIVIDFTF
jgi:hypothetical protein